MGTFMMPAAGSKKTIKRNDKKHLNSAFFIQLCIRFQLNHEP